MTAPIPIGITTPGPPAGEGTPLGTCSHATHRTVTWELYRHGQKLHLWHGDWIRGEFEIWRFPDGYVAKALPLVGRKG